MTNEKVDRVLIRMGAHELTQEQIAHVAGGDTCSTLITFHPPHSDIFHDCQ